MQNKLHRLKVNYIMITVFIVSLFIIPFLKYFINVCILQTSLMVQCDNFWRQYVRRKREILELDLWTIPIWLVMKNYNLLGYFTVPVHQGRQKEKSFHYKGSYLYMDFHALVVQVVLMHCMLSVVGKLKCSSASRKLGKTLNYKSHVFDKKRCWLF